MCRRCSVAGGNAGRLVEDLAREIDISTSSVACQRVTIWDEGMNEGVFSLCFGGSKWIRRKGVNEMIVAWYCGLVEEGTTMRASMGVDGVNGSIQWGDKAWGTGTKGHRHGYRHRNRQAQARQAQW